MNGPLSVSEAWADAVWDAMRLRHEAGEFLSEVISTPALADAAAERWDKAARILESVPVPDSEEAFRRAEVTKSRAVAQLFRDWKPFLLDPHTDRHAYRRLRQRMRELLDEATADAERERL